MAKTPNLHKIISEGTGYLAEEQQPDGSFLSLSSPNPRSFAKAKKYHTIFPAFLVLSCLNTLEETPKIKTINRKATKSLLSQKSEHWSFNYWVRSSKEAKALPYPDDLDDTFCALAALWEYNPELIDGVAMAKIITLLTAVEEKEGGPYRTWLVPPDADEVWKDVDLAANSNIAYFLSLQDVSLPNINGLIESAIETENYTSPYYPTVYPIIYFISRSYKGKKTKKMRDLLLSKRESNGKWENPLNTALAVSSLLNLGTPPNKLEKSIDYLISQQAGGSRKPYAFCVDPAIKGKRYYAGSAAVTTAFCLEATGKYHNKLKMKSDKLKVGIRESEEQEKIYKEVVKRAKQRFSALDGDLRTEAIKCLKTALKGDKDEQIVLIPHFFKVSLGEGGKTVPRDLLVKLGVTNLYGWIAYRIYDDFLDEEGDPKLLSVANLCLRESTTIYNNLLPKETGFPVFLQKVVDAIDAANTWEVAHCRAKVKNEKLEVKNLTIPDYGNLSRLAERSLGHALGPLAILFTLGFTDKSPEVKTLMKFFKHYLTARQLNDDAHDWERDLKMGHINAVGAMVLEKFKVKSSKLKVNSQVLQEIFWHKVAVDVCQAVLKHTRLARRALEKIPIITDPSLLERLLIPIEYSAQKALKEREETLKFLKAYGKTPL